jgi:hypothetical protein
MDTIGSKRDFDEADDKPRQRSAFFALLGQPSVQGPDGTKTFENNKLKMSKSHVEVVINSSGHVLLNVLCRTEKACFSRNAVLSIHMYTLPPFFYWVNLLGMLKLSWLS